MKIKAKRIFLYLLIALPTALIITFLYAMNEPDNEEYTIDLSGFTDSAHHWYDVYEKANIIDPKPDQKRYEPQQISKIADNILLYQRENGGWPKNYDVCAVLTREQKEKFLKAKNLNHTTFDNSTTFTHIEYLAKAYDYTKVKKYKEACLRGIDFTLSAQYANGGWPQFYPLEDNYSTHITFNDDSMIGIMRMLKNIVDDRPYYSFLDSERREKVKTAFEKGIDCILKCQIKDGDKLTAWCQQHDENDFSPAKARAYELPSICNDESSDIVNFLMSIDNPSKEIKNSIQSAVKWFEESKLYGIRVEEIEADEVKFSSRVNPTKRDRIVVEDPNARVIWARFYQLKTYKPFFSNRESEVLETMAEVDRERRTGYSWYTYKPTRVLRRYRMWQNKWASTQKME